MLKRTLKKCGSKRAAAVAILAIGAIGATQLPKRHTVTMSERSEMVTDSEQAVVFGTNNLLGGLNADVDGAARAAELSQDHLISSMSVNQAGDSTLLRELRSLTQASDDSKLAVAAIAGSSMAIAGATAAVPEPATAGVMAAMVVPALLRRRRSWN